MTRSKYRIHESHRPHFLTWTIVGWLPVFTRREAVEIVLDSWRFLQRERELALFGYVNLENHLHLIASAPELAVSIKHSKSFTARQIVDLLERRFAETLLPGSCGFTNWRTRTRATIRYGRKGAIRSRSKPTR
jgi:putative transposase